jgi:hypothetical protein
MYKKFANMTQWVCLFYYIAAYILRFSSVLQLLDFPQIAHASKASHCYYQI